MWSASNDSATRLIGGLTYLSDDERLAKLSIRAQTVRCRQVDLFTAFNIFRGGPEISQDFVEAWAPW